MTDSRAGPDMAASDAQRPAGHPLIATVICAVLLILCTAGAGGGERGAGMDGAYLVGHLFGDGIFAGILWGIAYAVTIKRASGTWQIGTLVALIVIGMLFGLLQLGAGIGVRQSDARDTVNQLKQVIYSDRLPDHVAAGNGPLSRMSAAFLNHLLDDQRALERDLGAAGFMQVISLDGLTPASPVLRRCSDFAPLAARARHMGIEGRRENLAAAREIGDAEVTAGRLSAGDEAAFFEGAEESRAAYERQWALNAEVLEEGQAVCQLLASRPWALSNGRVMFTRPGDAERMNAHLRRIQADAAEQDRMRSDVRVRTSEQINAMGH